MAKAAHGDQMRLPSDVQAVLLAAAIVLITIDFRQPDGGPVDRLQRLAIAQALPEAVDNGQGVLFIVKNYAGDVMNFQMAAEMMDRWAVAAVRESMESG